ncbi:transposase [Agathobaculum sp. NTUH-O15-33]|uniref:transposase n=1 Tax=Agathobaculum sp. NTUH-O15-33 TaxID=3079302 RepID=UPI0029587B20|nr:transposase [Agathobaculum sp. NTUH-O15-33]WNX86202.1 transposase [Agathobaculum sp. NTUH-O15-33]
MQLPKRKHPRLKAYDYSESGVYFLTVCTKNKVHSLGEIVGRGDLTPPLTVLTATGKKVCKIIQTMSEAYHNVRLLHFVVMPNHIHILLELSPDVGGVGSPRPTQTSVPNIIKGFKAMTRRACGSSLWQTGYYDHIIRNDADLQTHWTYIDENSAKWADDAYF